MNTSKYFFAFVALVAVIFAAAFSAPAATAQEEAFNPNTPVSDLEGEMAIPETTGSRIIHPRRGVMEKTPEKIPSEYLNLPEKLGPGQEPTPESVIGADGRIRVTDTTVYPYRVIAYLSMQFSSGWYRCTGWIVGPRLVVTAGHCVHDKNDGGWAKQVYVYPGKNGSSAPYGSRSKYRLFSVTGWTSYKYPNYDYGAIQTSGTAFTNWFGYRAPSSFGGTHTISGYPADKAGYYQWRMSGSIVSINTYKLYYYIDTYGGQSGAPVYQVYNSKCCYGVGVHAYGGSTNSATRINSGVLTNINAWRSKPYP